MATTDELFTDLEKTKVKNKIVGLENKIGELEKKLENAKEEYGALQRGFYLVLDGEKRPLYVVWEWEQSRGCSSKTGHQVAIVFNRHEAMLIRNGLRAINEDAYITYTVEVRDPYNPNSGTRSV